MKSTKANSNGEAKEIKKITKTYKNGRYWSKDQLDTTRKYNVEYARSQYRTFVFRLNNRKDADMIQFCESQDNLTALIKDLLRKEMISQNREEESKERTNGKS